MSEMDSENLISLDKARKLAWLDRPVSFTTIWTWATKGLNGVLLETRYSGSTLCTSEQAMRRFSAARRPPPSAGDLAKRARQADALLDRLGVGGRGKK